MNYNEMISQVDIEHKVTGYVRAEIPCNNGLVMAKGDPITKEWEWEFFKNYVCPSCHKTKGVEGSLCPLCGEVYQ